MVGVGRPSRNSKTEFFFKFERGRNSKTRKKHVWTRDYSLFFDQSPVGVYLNTKRLRPLIPVAPALNNTGGIV